MRLMLTLSVLAILTSGGCRKKAQEGHDHAGHGAQLNISGTIELDPALAKQAKKTDAIFLIARPAQGGAPVAVEKFEGNSYPYKFALTAAHGMSEGPVEGPLSLMVRVDKDGDAMTKAPGDLLGEYDKNPVEITAQNVVIKVNQVLKK